MFYLVLTLAALSGIICQDNVQTYSYSSLPVTVTWSNNGTHTAFTATSSLKGNSPSNAWLGIGLNSQAIMNGLNAVICQNVPGSVFVQMNLNSWFDSNVFDSTNPTLGLSDTQINVVGSNLTCSFVRENYVAKSSYNYVSSSSSLYLITAFGSGKLAYHGSNVASTAATFPSNYNSTTPVTPVTPSFGTKIKDWFNNAIAWVLKNLFNYPSS